MRAALLILALLTLSACNVVVTRTPMFSVADEAGAAPMKPGVWAFEDPACTFDETRPILQWPNCAGGAVIGPGFMMGHDNKGGRDQWERLPLVLARGDPRVAQVLF